MPTINVTHAGKIAASSLKGTTGSLILLEAFQTEWTRVTSDLTAVEIQAAGDLAVGALKTAMDAVNTRADQRAYLIAMFFGEWNLLVHSNIQQTNPSEMGIRMRAAG